jgi:PAS domain S-box-containing protein
MQTSAERTYTESLGALAPENIAFVRSLAHTARNGIVLVDRSGIIQVFNKAALRIIKKRTDQVLGKRMNEILPNSWRDMQLIFQTGKPQIAKRVDIGQDTIIANRTPIYDKSEIVAILSVF